MSNLKWNNLDRIEQLEEIDASSETQPVVIFKHSTRCSISGAALNRLERKWDEAETHGTKTYLLDLIAHRDVSNEIASRYGVDHQSPQVLVIQNGSCIYDNSHFGISYDELLAKIKPVSA
ncbi:bacillithiol system redox-active protein YtxJ [Marinoscillum furvescens]|uniref:Bacillithiol system protein YtxJ n=1 Tax=Marinoscillum furvescens DSM 4134 TaxID=1122208 RepID=A0A3D9L2F0_MARFU|nr:bacillithiol system redox-active protein YtxJ [Marinoscillum furvescens]RED98898.1 bacillithiol system protein YtxJ [Marinoscillum furvescens DSM 4134]